MFYLTSRDEWKGQFRRYDVGRSLVRCIFALAIASQWLVAPDKSVSVAVCPHQVVVGIKAESRVTEPCLVIAFAKVATETVGSTDGQAPERGRHVVYGVCSTTLCRYEENVAVVGHHCGPKQAMGVDKGLVDFGEGLVTRSSNPGC